MGLLASMAIRQMVTPVWVNRDYGLPPHSGLRQELMATLPNPPIARLIRRQRWLSIRQEDRKIWLSMPTTLFLLLSITPDHRMELIHHPILPNSNNKCSSSSIININNNEWSRRRMEAMVMPATAMPLSMERGERACRVDLPIPNLMGQEKSMEDIMVRMDNIMGQALDRRVKRPIMDITQVEQVERSIPLLDLVDNHRISKVE